MAKTQALFGDGRFVPVPEAALTHEQASLANGQAAGANGLTGVIQSRGDGVVILDTRAVHSLATIGNDGTAAAIAIGEQVYVQANGVVNKNSAGSALGRALDPVASGATTTIRIKIG